MSASRLCRSIITRRCTALICCGNQNTASRARAAIMKPADVCLAVMVAVIWGLAFVASRIAQSQALFTIAFAVIAFRELPTPMQTLGIGIATIGLLMICGTVGFDFS